MIATQQAKVYFAPTARRRFLTKPAAINAEARAIIKKHIRDEPAHDCSEEECGWCRDPGWRFEDEQPERFARYYRMLTQALKKAAK
jgi:hypothetical protein